MRGRLFLSLAGLAVLTLALYAALASQGVRGPGAIALIVGIAVAAGLAPLLSRPIDQAARFAEDLSHGESPRRLPETGGGEAGDLHRALNRLAEAQRLRLEELGAGKIETDLLLREMGEGVLALGPAGTIVRANSELRSVIGASEPIEGRAIGAILRDPHLVRLLSPADIPEEGAQGEFDVFGRTMLVSARRLPAGGAVAVFSDLTELRRLDTVRTEFVANASHELKTPLTAIRGYAETLLDPGIPEADRESFAGRIVSHAERMAAIVDDLLTLARLEEPGVAVRQEPTAIRPLAQRVLDSLAERAAEAQVTMTALIDPPDLSLQADPEGVRHILENLCDNAIRHSAAGSVEIRAAIQPSGEVRISVLDDGQGIPEAHLERIFERFYRVDASRSSATGGTGLGLSIVKHWVEAMGGRVWAESRLGEGTTINVTFPA